MLLEFYEVEKKPLGQGNFGRVHRCRRRTDGVAFACKAINVSEIGSVDLTAIHAEIAILREVKHPNIVTLKEVFYGSSFVFLILELFEVDGT